MLIIYKINLGPWKRKNNQPKNLNISKRAIKLTIILLSSTKINLGPWKRKKNQSKNLNISKLQLNNFSDKEPIKLLLSESVEKRNKVNYNFTIIY